jgi:hydrogenase expression/formation protein HypC
MCLGIPGRIVELHDDRGTPMAIADFGGVTREVCLVYVPEAQVGTYAIVHAGFAITSVDEASALETLAMLSEMGPLEDELGPPEPGDLPTS